MEQKKLNDFKEFIEVKIICDNCKHIQIKMVEIPQNNEWNIINKQIERSKIPRIGWKRILGKSLTKYVAEQFANGLSSNDALVVLKDKIRDNGILMKLRQEGWSAEQVLSNLKIGVCARYGEIKSERNEIKRVKQNEN